MSDSDRESPPTAGAGESPERPSRTPLLIPVQAKIGRVHSKDSRLRDVSVTGFGIDWSENAEVGQTALVRFAGHPDVCPDFILLGRVARIIRGEQPGLGIAIDHTGCSEAAIEHFHQLVQYHRDQQG